MALAASAALISPRSTRRRQFSFMVTKPSRRAVSLTVSESALLDTIRRRWELRVRISNTARRPRVPVWKHSWQPSPL